MKSPVASKILKFFLLFVLFQMICFAIFANSFNNGWTYDDFPVIVENPDIQNVDNFLADQYPGRPLREITFLVDNVIFGMSPKGWHIQQIFWHGLNATLLCLLGIQLGLRPALAFLAALLFAAHPLTAEVVGNLSHRKDSLALAGILSSLLAYVNFRLDQAWKRLIWLAIALLFLGFGWLAKEIAIAIPVLWAIYEMSFQKPQSRFLTRFRWLNYGVVLVCLAYAINWYWIQGGRSAYLKSAEFLYSKINVFGPVNEGDFSAMLLKAWGFMFGKIVWPKNLAIEYLLSPPTGWLDPWVVGTLIVVFCYVVTLFWSWRKSRLLFFSMACIPILWAPVSNIWPSAYFAADRYLYSILPWIALAVTASVQLLGRNPQRITLAIILLLLFPATYLTRQQNKIWESEWTLWTNAFKVSPENAYVLNTLGVLYGDKGDMKKAFGLIGKAAQNPFCQECQENMAHLYEWLGNKEKAKIYYKRAMNPHGQ